MFTVEKILNPIQDGGSLPTSFSPVTSTHVGISPQNFLIFSFNHFATLASPKIIEFEPRLLPKISGFSGQILIKLQL